MMMRAANFTVALLLLVFSSGPIFADIYKYRDAQGVVRYTYDLAEVPENQRPQIETYEEASAESDASLQDGKESGGEQEKADKKSDDQLVVDEKTIEEMNQKKKALDEEFAGLMEEKYKLLKEKTTLETLAGRDTVVVAEYDNKVRELNRKITDYQKRRKAFEEKAEAIKEAVENPES